MKIAKLQTENVELNQNLAKLTGQVSWAHYEKQFGAGEVVDRSKS